MSRTAKITRKTNETDVMVYFSLDGSGTADVATGIGFFDHILTSFATHGRFDLTVKASGDLEVDEHHTIEDVGIVLGSAIAKSFGNKKGIARFGEARIPMDEAIASVAIDVSGRSFLVYSSAFKTSFVGSMNTQMVKHFFESLVSHAEITLHIEAKGNNDHHICEVLFKAFGVALRRSCVIEGDNVPSTKGVL
ncbi:MAG: imidazoleglycerol-phosphate dehydratase HisB [Methanosarcinales archaeon]|uniref:Imidazoleglycerol-phosphate dehydratase n=1 Tax=Candidatus Ethanoperedens thermophilum TaxID=2766897 RepID=A0A848D8D8_9EURY|nr:imidazoleglycerol-phosphate dehydratase HisB [Candidatus Ethanoperedens thermophilum]